MIQEFKSELTPGIAPTAVSPMTSLERMGLADLKALQALLQGDSPLLVRVQVEIEKRIVALQMESHK